MIIFQLVFLILVFIILKRSIVIVPENQRLIVSRLGKFYDLKQPGMHLIIPFLDLVKRVNLTEKLPGYKGLSSEKIADAIVQEEFGKEVLERWKRES